MKISDHLLEIIKLNGGRVHPADFDRWIEMLAEHGRVEKDFVEDQGYKTIYWKLKAGRNVIET